MMRYLTAVAVLVALAAVGQPAAAGRFRSSICTTIEYNGTKINPAKIPGAMLMGLSDEGKGSYTVSINVCSPAALGGGCSANAGFASFSNASGACAVVFDLPLSHPSANAQGVHVQYTSSKNRADELVLTIRCNTQPGAGPQLVSKTHRFSTHTPNTKGGTTYELIVESSLVCSARPGATCAPFNSSGHAVDPTQWEPAFLTLDVGFSDQAMWLFSVCNGNPQPPSFAATCSPNGHVVEYNGSACLNVTFDKFDVFDWDGTDLNLHYLSTTQPTYEAHVKVSCLQGVPYLSSPTGYYQIKNNTAGGKDFKFELGISDLCPPTTASPTLAPGSGSNTMPPVPPNSGSGSNPTPSGNSGSSAAPPPVPSGGSGSMPSDVAKPAAARRNRA